jgi:integrase
MPITKRTVKWTTNDGQRQEALRYQADHTDRSGKRHRKLFDLRKDAVVWLKEQDAGFVSGRWADPKLGKQLFAAYAEDWHARQVTKPSTLRVYRSRLDIHLLPAFGGMRLESITRPMIEREVRVWTDSAAPATVTGRYNLLATILRSAVRDKVLPDSPCQDVKLPEIGPRSLLVPITTDTVLAIADAIEPHYRAFVIVGAGSGLRRGELLGLTLDHVSPEFGSIRVVRQLAPTVGEAGHQFTSVKRPSSVRTVDVAPVVTDTIAQHVERYGVHDSGLIFMTKDGRAMSANTIAGAWVRAAKRVGTDATPHSLRHYFASVQLAGGTSITKLASMLGHKNVSETLDTYGHLMGDEGDKARTVMQSELAGTWHSNGTVEAIPTLAERRLRRSDL